MIKPTPPLARSMKQSEPKRLTSHALWAGIAAEITGFRTQFMTCLGIRERLMDILETISGNRVHYAMNSIGGANREIANPEAVLSHLFLC
jgi:Ni,Fe-hydrogenase III large subunit